jgi:hypothetical protein
MSKRRALLVWLIVALLAYLDAAHPLVRQPIAELFLAGLISAIAAVFGWLADKAVTIGTILWQVAVLIGRAVGQAMIGVASVLGKTFGVLGKLWSNVLRPFVGWAWREFQALHAWLERTFRPALEFLYKVRAKILELYTKYMRPVLDTIEITRRLLQLLAALRLEWARTLDRKLAELEHRLTLPLLEAMRAINWTINWIDRIVDFDGFFQRVTLIQSLLRYERDAWNVWWTSVRGREVEKGKVTTGAVPESTPAAAAKTVTSYIRGADIPEMADVEEHATDLWVQIRRGGALPF